MLKSEKCIEDFAPDDPEDFRLARFGPSHRHFGLLEALSLTFWTAFAFGALAVVGVASSVYSAAYARRAFDVGLLQYQLALAQACSAVNATDELPGFCLTIPSWNVLLELGLKLKDGVALLTF
ncbi:hypothetical protein diail_863 [Diaporthe ilicicola]|nr:hypothetical protein diail_863 [Diaporthe ilicicola]